MSVRKSKPQINDEQGFSIPRIKRLDLSAKSKGLRPVFATYFQYECTCGNQGTAGWYDSYSDAWGYYG